MALRPIGQQPARVAYYRPGLMYDIDRLAVDAGSRERLIAEVAHATRSWSLSDPAVLLRVGRSLRAVERDAGRGHDARDRLAGPRTRHDAQGVRRDDGPVRA